MAINAAADLGKALQTPKSESPFQVGESKLKAIMEFANIVDAETKITNKDELTPPPPAPIIKKSSKLPMLEDQTDSTPRVDPYK